MKISFFSVAALSLVISSASHAYPSNTVSAGVTQNPDGSYTIQDPKILRGNRALRIYTSPEGACRLFGFDKFLGGTAKDHRLSAAEQTAKLNSSGAYEGLQIALNPYREITCYRTGELTPARGANALYRNPDGSYTIENPRLLRGNEALPIYTSAEGACRLFGFQRYLRDSSRDESLVSRVRTAKLNNVGSYTGIQMSSNPYSEVTCYNQEELTLVGTANGVIYYYQGNPQSMDFSTQGIRLQQLQ